MKVSNLRKITDPTTFEPSVVVDVEIPRMTLYELTLMKEDIRKDIIYTIGAELLEQIVVQMGMTDEQKKQPYRDWETDRKSTRLNSSHSAKNRMPSSA